MKKRKQEILGFFWAVDEKQEIRKIIISQDIISHYSGTTSHTKNLHLDTIHGVEVTKTDDPDVFLLPDGTSLRRKGSLRTS